MTIRPSLAALSAHPNAPAGRRLAFASCAAARAKGTHTRADPTPPVEARVPSGEALRLLSPALLQSGEITLPDLLNPYTGNPERGGLFCSRAFGPTHDWRCLCGKYEGERYAGIACEKCGVELAPSRVREERFGWLAFSSPAAHPWALPWLEALSGLSASSLARVLACREALVVSPVDDAPPGTLVSIARVDARPVGYDEGAEEEAGPSYDTGARALRAWLTGPHAPAAREAVTAREQLAAVGLSVSDLFIEGLLIAPPGMRPLRFRLHDPAKEAAMRQQYEREQAQDLDRWSRTVTSEEEILVKTHEVIPGGLNRRYARVIEQERALSLVQRYGYPGQVLRAEEEARGAALQQLFHGQEAPNHPKDAPPSSLWGHLWAALDAHTGEEVPSARLLRALWAAGLVLV